MRPIKLKMSAFGAYVKPVELDFVKGLGDDKFFLINGATGSGKTTILDAICYALYGKSSGGNRTGEMMRSDQAAPQDKTEVEFIFSLRDKTYRIVRNPKYMRARLRGDGMTEEKASAVIFENEKQIEVKNVSEYVENLLQFKCEQFRQVIMLPQGEFKKFLMAKSNEKQEVLNTLFNADFFKRVEEELKIKASESKKSFEEQETRKKNYLEQIGCAEEEIPIVIMNLERDSTIAKEKIKTLETAVDQAQKNYNAGENLSILFRDFEVKSHELNNAEKVLKQISGEQKAAQVEYDKRLAEESLREELKLLAAELGKKKSSLKNLQSKQSKLQKALTDAEKSTSEVEQLLKFKKLCYDTMNKVKSDVEKLQDSPAKLKVMEQKLKDAEKHEKLLSEIKKLRRELATAEKDLIAAEKSHDTAEKNLENLREAQKSGSAARLAATLEEGKPCPVCGSIHHPKPAQSDSSIPTDAQIKAAESKLKTLADKKISAEKNLSRLKGELETKEKNLSESAEVMTVAAAQAEFDKISADVKELGNLNSRIKNGEVKISETEEQLTAAIAADKRISGLVENLRGEVNNMMREIEEKYSSNPELLDAEINSTQKRLDELNLAFQNAQSNLNRQNNRLSAQKSTVEAAQRNKSEITAQIAGKTPPDMLKLKKVRDDSRAAHNSAIETKTELSERLKRTKMLAEKISAIKNALETAEKKYLMWKTLSDAASGKISKISFQRYYLSTMFKEIIVEANNRLEKMSGGRYRFKNKEETTDKRYSGGLDLEIEDDYTGTRREVETLSGGESFLASLSLALGLAAVVQNNSGGIKLDTIFIDEGFGTLDNETLDFALKTLMELQSGGRLVGIISHVEELKNQMPVRLEVTKAKSGSTAEFIRAH